MRDLQAACPKSGSAAILLRLRRAVFCGKRVKPGSGVFNSQSANRRLAFRMVAVQFVVAMLVALLFLAIQGVREGLAAAIGGGAVAAGSLVLAWRSLPPGAASAGLALSRLVSGLLLKWFVVLGALYLAMAKLALPPLPLLVGLVIAMMAAFLTLNSKA